ncbi:hypothetical protein, partial [Mesorhizobium sp. M1C.F.Ca.ET.193.01.1.1]|uniref:hypothetical protein n=1 Tax=Mesorhizobium sp. M1C.F.Ca.ET.193.01.1.1 TaxID=2563926 RepID=UPI001AEF139A
QILRAISLRRDEAHEMRHIRLARLQSESPWRCSMTVSPGRASNFPYTLSYDPEGKAMRQ